MKYNPDLSKAKSKDIAKDHIDFDSEDHLDVLYDAVSYTFGWSDSQKIDLDVKPDTSYKIISTMKANPHVDVGESAEEMPSNIVKESFSDLITFADNRSWPNDNSKAEKSISPTELGSLRLKTQQLSKDKEDLELIISTELKKRMELNKQVQDISLELKNSKMEFQDYKHSQGKELESRLWEIQVLNKKLKEADMSVKDQIYAYEADKKLKWRQLEWKHTPLKGKRNDLRSLIKEKRNIREQMLDHIKRFTVSANRKSQTAENQAQGSGSYNSDIASFNYLGRLEI